MKSVKLLSREKEVKYAQMIEEGGSVFGVTRERIRQIEAKAYRRLRNPKYAKRLEGFT